MGTAEVPVNPPARLFDDSFLRFLPSPLREASSAWKTLAAVPLLTMPVSLVLAYLVAVYLPFLKGPDFPKCHWLGDLFSIVVLSPVVETLLMAAILWVFLKYLSQAHAIVASAVTWGLLHSLAASAWGLVVWWPFIIFSTIYLVWKQRGFWVGASMAASAHLIHNFIGLGLANLSGR